MSGGKLFESLKAGGYVVYFRHGQTERGYADQAPKDLVIGDCSTQRVLSQTGWQDMRSVGEAWKDKGIPAGQVVSSQYCRAWQSADLAFGKHQKTADLNFEPAEEFADEQMQAMNGVRWCERAFDGCWGRRCVR